jgi:hypothetical protein
MRVAVITGCHAFRTRVISLADNLMRCLGLKTLSSTIIVVKNDRHVTVTDYDPKTGSPLSQPTVKSAIVSYEYREHPAHRLGDKPPNQYHVLGTFGQGDDGERLAIVSVNRATLEEAASLLRQSGLGVKEPIMTFDGGTSTYLFSAQQGRLLLPEAVGTKSEAVLPHYLGFRRRPL